ncbi:MAG: hypothetical protein JW819_05040 [Candidatus Krumholzibacteriota bacterium]|nr:hypothetical protein [Candidatus Krumholzibacteriota bacterium]
MRKPLLLLAMLTLASPAAAIWETVPTGAACGPSSPFSADHVHGRVYYGTGCGFLWRDTDTGDWTAVEDPEADRRVRAIGWHPQHDQFLILGCADEDDHGWIEVTEDLGATSTVVYSPAGLGPPGRIERDPTDADRFYAISYPGGWTSSRVLTSADGGWTWETVAVDPDAPFRSLAVDMAGVVYVGGDYGVMRSADQGGTWESAQGDLPTGRVRCLAAVNPGAPGHVMAGVEVGLFETVDGGGHWDAIIMASTWSCYNISIHPDHPDIVAAHFSVGIGPADFVLLTRNGWQTWEYTHYYAIAIDWCSLGILAISAGDQRIYANNFDDIVTCDLFTTGAADPAPAPSSIVAAPNPFNPKTTIHFSLPADAPVQLRIHDLRGRCVRTLIDGAPYRAGRHQVLWDGLDDGGEALASGLYLCRLEAGGHREAVKITLLK